MSAGKDMSIWEHLEELRWTLLKSIAMLLLCTCLGFAFTGVVYRALLFPVRQFLDPELVDRHFRSTADTPHPSSAGQARGQDPQAPEQTRLLLEQLRGGDLETATRLTIQDELIALLNQRLDILEKRGGQQSVGRRVRIVYASPIEPFTIKLKVAFLGGVLFAVPFICYFIWSFVGPGLGESERRVVSRSLGLAVPLFLIGAGFGYSFLPFGIPALMKFAAAGVEQIWPLKAYIGFCVRLVLAFGIVFEMPLVLGVLTRLGVVQVETLRKARPYAVIVFFILAAVLTPPDIYSQIALAIPMLALYELSIWIGKIQARRAAA